MSKLRMVLASKFAISTLLAVLFVQLLAFQAIPTAHASSIVGYVDYFTVSYSGDGGMSGWACAQAAPNTVIRVDFYNSSTYMGSVAANELREAAVGSACGGNSYHGFHWNTNSYCFSLQHHPDCTIYIYGVYTTSDYGQLNDSPQVFHY